MSSMLKCGWQALDDIWGGLVGCCDRSFAPVHLIAIPRPPPAHPNNSRTRGGQGSSSAPSSSRRAPASTRCRASKSTPIDPPPSPLGRLAHYLSPPRPPTHTHTHRFDHPPEAIQQTLQLQSTPYPVRPGELQCAYYLKTGKCKFGATCRFDHPPMAPEQGASSHVPPQTRKSFKPLTQT